VGLVITRRSLLGGILLAGAAPAILRSGIAMPVAARYGGRFVPFSSGQICAINGDNINVTYRRDDPLVLQGLAVLTESFAIQRAMTVRGILVYPSGRMELSA
jgi:hypothetical protein